MSLSIELLHNPLKQFDFIADDRLKNKTKIEKCIMKSLNYNIYNKIFWMKKKDYTA